MAAPMAARTPSGMPWARTWVAGDANDRHAWNTATSSPAQRRLFAPILDRGLPSMCCHRLPYFMGGSWNIHAYFIAKSRTSPGCRSTSPECQRLTSRECRPDPIATGQGDTSQAPTMKGPHSVFFRCYRPLSGFTLLGAVIGDVGSVVERSSTQREGSPSTVLSLLLPCFIPVFRR